MDRLQLLDRRVGSPFRLKVRHLAADHPARSGGLGQNPDAFGGGTRWRAGDKFEGERQQAVAREDGSRLVERAMTGRSAASQIVVIHRRKIVVDQGIRVNHLQRAGGRQSVFKGAPTGFGREQTEHGPEPLAAGERAISHRLGKPRRATEWVTDGGRQESVQRLVDPPPRLAPNVGESPVVGECGCRHGWCSGVQSGHPIDSAGGTPSWHLVSACPTSAASLGLRLLWTIPSRLSTHPSKKLCPVKWEAGTDQERYWGRLGRRKKHRKSGKLPIPGDRTTRRWFRGRDEIILPGQY